MAKQFTVQDFFKRFPDDDACLAHLMRVRHGERVKCPRCGKEGRFVRLPNQPAFCCPTPRCGHHIHPMVGTPFERSHTALSKWFYAMYLFTASRHGVSAKELQRQLGVTYKTAWRIAHEIRKYMAKVDGDDGLSGHIEIDETYVGGQRPGNRGRNSPSKSVVFGMIERGGDLITRIVPNARKRSLLPHVFDKVTIGSEISSDEWQAYAEIGEYGYTHGTVNHGKEEWARGKTHTNTIEGFWAMLKRSIRSTHIHVSKKHLAKYLGEFEYRWNMRKHPEKMLARLLLAF